MENTETSIEYHTSDGFQLDLGNLSASDLPTGQVLYSAFISHKKLHNMVRLLARIGASHCKPGTAKDYLGLSIS